MKNENGQLKNQKAYKIANTFKKVGSKVLLGLLALGIAIGGTFAFVGCNKTPQVQEPPAVVQPENPGGELNPGGEIEVQKTFEDFLKSDLADDFASWFAVEALAQKEGIMGKEYYVYGHDDVVTGINFLYIYGDKATENRTMELMNIKFNNELDVDDVMADVNIRANYRISTQKIMDFNAKTNKLNTEIATALYKAANLQDQDLQLFKEAENNRKGYRTFTIFSQDENNKIQLYEITVESDETNLLDNLADSTKVTITAGRTYLNDGNKIVFSDEYDLGEENYKPEEVGPGGEIDPPGPGGEVEQDKVTNAEILQAFEENKELSNHLLQNSQYAIWQDMDLSKVSNETWYLSSTADDKISGFDYSFEYTTGTNVYYELNSVKFKSPVSKEDLVKGNFDINNLIVEGKYSLNYNKNIQEANKDLTNAIFTALGVADTGATRIIVEKSKGGVGDAEFGQYNSYKVIEISNNEVKEYDVTVKYAADMVEQVEKGNIRKDAEQTTEINGSKLTAEAESKQEDVSSIYSNDMWKITLDGEEFTF